MNGLKQLSCDYASGEDWPDMNKKDQNLWAYLVITAKNYCKDRLIKESGQPSIQQQRQLPSPNNWLLTLTYPVIVVFVVALLLSGIMYTIQKKRRKRHETKMEQQEMMQIKKLDSSQDEVIEIDSEESSLDFGVTTEFTNDDRSSVVVVNEKNIIRDNENPVVRDDKAKSFSSVDLLSDNEITKT